MKRPRSLRSRILLWLGAYSLLLSAAVLLHGLIVNEAVEATVWDTLVRAELDHHLERMREDPGYRWRDTEGVQLYADPGRPAPAALARLDDGVHDELSLDGREVLAFVDHADGVRYTLVLDISQMEAEEFRLTMLVLGLSLALVTVMVVLASWGLRRALRPLSDLAGDIAALVPDRPGQRVVADPRAGAELGVIASALNDYLGRHERFVERERAFIDTASHELRTPIAVIAGASELALGQPGLPEPARLQMQRVHRTARDVEQLIALLLTLAKDPARISRNNDLVLLHELLPDIIDDHHHLMEGKDLSVVVEALAPCTVQAPLHIVQAAIGNLLRNAIENSDRGEIRVRLEADATVTIRDPGHGMSPEDISRIYAQMARGAARGGGGIGLNLLARLCEHLGWTLSIESAPGRGTLGRLRLAR